MPTIYCITNEVSANFVANALLAVGASPIMSSAIEEVDDLCAIADALLINIGTPSQAQFQTMLAAGKRMHELGKPIVLDPVGVNATHYRLEMAQTLIRETHPTVIKGNASEILALATSTVLGTGLDTPLYGLPIAPLGAENSQLSNLETTLHSKLYTLNSIANDLAKSVGSIIVVSGPTDYITDGTHTASVTLGSPDMAKTTGTGCVASAVIAAYITTIHHPQSTIHQAIKAMTLMGQAGEDMPHFLDRLSAFSAIFQ